MTELSAADIRAVTDGNHYGYGYGYGHKYGYGYGAYGGYAKEKKHHHKTGEDTHGRTEA